MVWHCFLGEKWGSEVALFWYLARDGEADANITHRIQVGRWSWVNCSSIICDQKVLIKSEGKFYQTTSKTINNTQ